MGSGWTAGRYIPMDSAIHRLDARVKLSVGFVFAVVLFMTKAWAGWLFLFAYVAVSMALSRIPPAAFVKGLRPVLLLVALSALFHIVFTPGTPIAGWGTLTVSQEGLLEAAMLFTRLTLLLTGLQVVTLTTSPLAMTDAIEWGLKPGRRFGLPVAEIALMMTIALTFVPVLWSELDRIVKAQTARGASFGVGNPLRRVRAFIPVIVPLFAGALRRADELSIAMESRGYRGTEGRSRWRESRWTATDGAVLGLSLLGLLWIGWKFGWSL